MSDSRSLETVLEHMGIDPRELSAGYRAQDPFIVATRLAFHHDFRVFPSHGIVPAPDGGLECSCAAYYRSVGEPACGSPGKTPGVTDWPGRATCNLSVLFAWKRKPRHRSANWSLATGLKSGVWGIDVDVPDDLEQLIRLYGKLPPTWRVNSGRIGGEGFHLYYRATGLEDLRTVRLSGFKVDPRGWGGQLILPGSLHKSGSRYQWAEGCAPDEIELAELPPAWLEILPKHIEAGERGAHSRWERAVTVDRSALSPRLKGSRVLGDHDGGGGFNGPVFNLALDWWRAAGPAASEERVIATLWSLIEVAPKGPGRDVERYRPGNGDLERAVRRAREIALEEEGMGNE